MKILNLIIKQHYFDAIMQGRKIQEFREVRPTTIKKLLQLDKDGYEVEDEWGNAQPIKYDAIRFYVGYNKDRDSALVEVKDAYCEMFTHYATDDNGNELSFKCDEEGNVLFFKMDENGEAILDEEGKPILAEEGEKGVTVLAEEGEKGAPYEVPITYEYGGEMWVAEQVVYNLGKILETDIHPKNRR